MTEALLTRDTERLLTALYKFYLEKRDAGYSREDAKKLGGADAVHRDIVPHMTLSDVEDCMLELMKADYIFATTGECTIIFSSLSDKAIIKLENKFKNNIKSVADFLAKFI